MTQTMRDYLWMSGYASVIWPVYGIAALVLIAFVADSWRRLHKVTAELRRLEATAIGQMGPTGAVAKPRRQAGS